MMFFISTHSTAIYTIHNAYPSEKHQEMMGDGKLKLKRGSNRGVQVAGVKVSEGSIKGNTEQIHQLCKRAEHNLCFYPFTWAVAKGHTDNMVYMRISLNKNSVHALEMLQVSPAAVKGWEWRGEEATGIKTTGWRTSTYLLICKTHSVQTLHTLLNK